MIYVRHARSQAIWTLGDQLRTKGYTETHSFNKVIDKYELVTDAPKEVVEGIIYAGSFPREVLEEAYGLEEI